MLQNFYNMVFLGTQDHLPMGTLFFTALTENDLILATKLQYKNPVIINSVSRNSGIYDLGKTKYVKGYYALA